MTTVAERSMGLGLKAIRQIAGLQIIDKVGLRGPAERALYVVTKNGLSAADSAGRRFAAVQGKGKAGRPKSASSSGLFDLTPDEDQQMIVEAMKEFAAAELRPAALAADTACAAPLELLASTTWKVPGDTGRRYAAVSGDRNPIHLYALTAKPFGFPRAIAHGLWTKARAVAALEARLPDAFGVDVEFRKPVLLPTTVTFGSTTSGDDVTSFAVKDAREGAAHLVGTVTPLDKPEPKAKTKPKTARRKTTTSTSTSGGTTS